MNIRNQNRLVNLVLCLFIFFGSMLAFWIYEATAHPEQGDKVCRNEFGHRVKCGAITHESTDNETKVTQ